MAFAALLVAGFSLDAQNLVPNPGFEEFKFCPGGYSERPEEFHVKDWYPANPGTPDHFNSCSHGEADVPHNWAGVSDAFEGHGYVGLYAWMNIDINYREFVQCKLISPLIKDSLYVFRFHYKLSSYSKFSIDRIGVLLTDSMVSWKRDRAPNISPTFHALRDSALTEHTGSWETGSWEFRASGGEQFVTIGNFYDNAQTRHYDIQFRTPQQVLLKDAAYYYLDGIELYSPFAKDSIDNLRPGFTPDRVALNTDYILKNIQFEFDSYKLLATSFDELDQLAAYALKYPRLLLQLSGHTDDIGGERYNKRLSENRAKTVAKYLLMQGVATERVEVAGYGKSKPLVYNDTDDARQINRRVEIRFSE
jgi:outer membrane protein OmpA-like peptidoglycan-associated protein